MHKMPNSPTSRANSASPQQEESPWRISRLPGSVITFASFDPSAATGSSEDTNETGMRKLSLNEELCRPKRVVIETSPDGRSTWRFIPKARWEEGIENEGKWPRVVDVCGKLTTLTQDQWDMYKLDRRYDCLIRLSPMPSVVRQVNDEPLPEPSSKTGDTEASSQASSLQGRDIRYTRINLSNHVKRRLSSGKVDSNKRARTVPSGYSSTNLSSEDDTAEEDEVNKLVDEGDLQKQDRAKKRYKTTSVLKTRAHFEEARRRRRELYLRRKAQLNSIEELKDGDGDEDEDVEMKFCSETPVPTPTRARSMSAAPIKRKASDGHISELEPESSEDESGDTCKRPRFRTYDKVGESKRTRALSPSSARRALQNRRSQWWRKRYEQNRQEAKARAGEREKKQMEELFEQASQRHAREQAEAAQREERSRAEAAQQEAKARSETAQREARARSEAARREARAQEGVSSGKATSDSSRTRPKSDTQADEEARRQASLEESRRKIAELEKDRPLWGEQARKRANAETEERSREENMRKAQAASEARAAADKEARAKQKADAERCEREDVAAGLRIKREKARKDAVRDANMWLRRGWTVHAALKRFKIQSEAFDKLNFFRGDVIVFETIPWPVLKRPNSFGVEDIDWTAVESFFKEVSLYLNADEYAKFVEKSHKRFHPDRWKSRRVLACVEDEEEKECLEVAANTVAQAITPLWQEVTGR